MSIAAVNLFYR